eukprot:scaffold50168_cov22-Tisochrysis_lutea.AAC.4
MYVGGWLLLELLPVTGRAAGRWGSGGATDLAMRCWFPERGQRMCVGSWRRAELMDFAGVRAACFQACVAVASVSSRKRANLWVADMGLAGHGTGHCPQLCFVIALGRSMGYANGLIACCN